MISLSRGVPSLDLINVDRLRQAMKEVLEEDPAGATSYGDVYGYEPLRSWLATRHNVTPSCIMVTNGSLHALQMVLQEIVGRGDVVALEQPTYDRTMTLVRDLGGSVMGVSMCPDGMAIDELTAATKPPKVVYTIPTCQNPTGAIYSAAKREAIVRYSERVGAIVLEDDPYRELVFDREPPPPLMSYANDNSRTIFIGSFSKVVCPGVRVGYIVASEALIERLARKASAVYITPGIVAQAVVYRFCREGGLEETAAEVRRKLASRATVLAECVQNELCDVTFVTPKGGYFLWLAMSMDVDVDSLVPIARTSGVTFCPGREFLLKGGRHAIRLSFATCGPDDIREGVRRLAHSVRTYRQLQGSAEAS
jgi:2-aminoadipate transaminase